MYWNFIIKFKFCELKYAIFKLFHFNQLICGPYFQDVSHGFKAVICEYACVS